MRVTVNISLPKSLDEEVNRVVKKEKYASKSEFFRYLFRKWKEERLLKNLQISEEEIRNGKGKVLHSLKELR